MIETEAKIGLDRKVYKRVSEHLFGREGPNFLLQKNHIYVLPEGFFRIREEDEKIFFTYKGKSIENAFNSREEIEFSTKGDIDDAVRMAEQMGLSGSFYYEKRRAVADSQNNLFIISSGGRGCAICLDVLSDGRKYLEIEGGTESIKKMIAALHLENFPNERRPYHELVRRA